MIHEGLWDSLRRWHKNLRSRLNHRPFFDIKTARRNFLMLLDSRPSLPTPREGEPEIIVSLTTFPARIRTVGWSLLSLFLQESLPHRIILNLSLAEFGGKQLPQEILELQKLGLEVFWNEDSTFSYLKIMPTLARFPDSIIVTCDDDQYYSTQWLHKLLNAHANAPEAIVAHRVHRILLDDNANPLPYNRWLHAHHSNNFANPSMLNFATGVGGVLYPPHCFFDDVCRKDLYTALCPKADDIWLWGMELLAGREILFLDAPERTLPTMVSQKIALVKDNIYHKFNDKQIKKLIEHYPQIREILQAESTKAPRDSRQS